MTIEFYVIPNGPTQLKPLVKGKDATTFDTYVNGVRGKTIKIPGRWGNDIFVADSWGVLKELRKEGIVDSDATIVVSTARGVRFPEGSIYTSSLGSRPTELNLPVDDVE